jgi:hypothetical protein
MLELINAARNNAAAEGWLLDGIRPPLRHSGNANYLPANPVTNSITLR